MGPTQEAPPKKRPAAQSASAILKAKGKAAPKSSGMKRPAAKVDVETTDTTANLADPDLGVENVTGEKETDGKTAPKPKVKAKGKGKAKASAKSVPKVKAKAKVKAMPKASEAKKKPGPGRRTRKRVTVVGSLNCFKGCDSNCFSHIVMPGTDDTVSSPYYYPAPRNVWGIKVNGTETLKVPSSEYFSATNIPKAFEFIFFKSVHMRLDSRLVASTCPKTS